MGACVRGEGWSQRGHRSGILQVVACRVRFKLWIGRGSQCLTLLPALAYRSLLVCLLLNLGFDVVF